MDHFTDVKDQKFGNMLDTGMDGIVLYNRSTQIMYRANVVCRNRECQIFLSEYTPLIGWRIGEYRGALHYVQIVHNTYLLDIHW